MVEPSARKNTYIMDAENGAEIARLSRLHRLVVSGKDGLLPAISQLPSFQALLESARR